MDRNFAPQPREEGGLLRRTGVAVVDRVIGGLAPGLPLVLAGPPGCGRTVIALQIAAAALRENDIVAFLSSEPAPLLLRQAQTLGLDLEPPVRAGQLLLLELDPAASAALNAAGGKALVEAISAEHPAVALVVVDAFTALTVEIPDEARLRSIARDLIASTPRTSLVLTVETERPVLDAPVERTLAEVCGSFLVLERRKDGRRVLRIAKTRAGAGRAEAVEFEIGAEGARLVRELRPEALLEAAPAARPGAPPRAVRPEPAPPARLASAPEAPGEPASAPAPRQEGPAKLLLIDDDAGAREEFCAWLSDRYRVVTANDGFQGVAKLLGERPDLIVLDLVLPRVSGYEVLAALHQANAAIPILVVASRIERRGDRLGPIVLGATDVLQKPVDRFELLHKIETALRLARAAPPRPDPVEAGVLFAPSSPTRVLSAGEFRDRVRRAFEFGARFGTPSTLAAVEAAAADALDRIAGAADRVLRLEDALLLVSKRRLLLLLVAADEEQARAVLRRLLAAAGDGAPPRARAALAEAAPCDEPDWKALFERLEPWDATGGAA
jgi:DNA-binding response OmpR family regulator/KaiC/GvpD/RAD55 family RecA-like ATPase